MNSGRSVLLRISRALFALRVVFFAFVTPALLRLKLVTLAALLEPRGHRAPRGEFEPFARRLDALLRRGRPLVRSGCLTRGVTLYYFLRRAGFDVALCFGVRPDGPQTVGHCWLARDGSPVLEREDPRSAFVEVFRIEHGITAAAS